MHLVPYAPLPMQQAEVEYAYGPDSVPRPGVVPGTRHTFTIADPAAFPGTVRDVVVHVPTGVPLKGTVAATVVLDGTWYLDPAGAFRAGIVLDNLVASGAVPPMVGVFVDPGVFPDVADEDARTNRNAEYDAPDRRFADFLADEVLPRVREVVPITTDPARVAVVGGSSGGNAAFTAAWHRPDVFGRVAGLGSSFAQMPGGNPYPDLIASEARRPIRVLLTAAHRDLGWNTPDENWFAENLLVAAALAKAGYDMRLVLREGGHSMVNGGAILPDALRWLWAEPERTRIAVALLVQDGKVLLGHRHPDRRRYPDCWDLLGGHVETGETPAEAVVRKVREELGVQVTSMRAVELPFADPTLDVSTFLVTGWEGEPANLAPDEHDDLRWFDPAELAGLTLADPGYADGIARVLGKMED